ASVTITTGVNLSTTVNVAKHPTVSVQVNEDDGSPAAITNATVTITPTSGATLTLAHAGTGLYSRTLVEPATYTVTVSKAGWATARSTITATAGVAFSTLTVGLQPLRDVTLVLFSETIDTGVSGLDGVT